MATVQGQSFEFCSGAVVWSYTYNDANNRLNSVTCVNNSPGKSTLTAVSNSTGAVATFVCDPHTTLDQAIPPGQSAQFGVTIVPHAGSTRVDGISWSVQQDGC